MVSTRWRAPPALDDDGEALLLGGVERRPARELRKPRMALSGPSGRALAARKSARAPAAARVKSRRSVGRTAKTRPGGRPCGAADRAREARATAARRQRRRRGSRAARARRRIEGSRRARPEPPQRGGGRGEQRSWRARAAPGGVRGPRRHPAGAPMHTTSRFATMTASRAPRVPFEPESSGLASVSQPRGGLPSAFVGGRRPSGQKTGGGDGGPRGRRSPRSVHVPARGRHLPDERHGGGDRERRRSRPPLACAPGARGHHRDLRRSRSGRGPPPSP